MLVNLEAEQFFDNERVEPSSGCRSRNCLPADSPIHFLIDQALEEGVNMSDYGVTLENAADSAGGSPWSRSARSAIRPTRR